MKTNLFFTASLYSILFAACSSNVSKQENPRGLYRLQDITYEETGKVIEYPFNQYYYLTDGGMLLINVEQDNLPHSTGSILCFSMSDNDYGIRPINYTGKSPKETKKEEIEVYDSNSKEFTLRWYNGRDDLVFNYMFPYKSYITEHYSSTKNVSKNLQRAMEILSNPQTDDNNKLIGVWHRKKAWWNVEGTDFTDPDEMFRIHTDKEVLILFRVYDNDGHVYAYCQLRPCKYNGNEATKEGNFECQIEWENDNCFELNVFNGSYKQYEIWERSGLSEGFQKILGTNVPINITPAIELPAVQSETIEYTETITETGDTIVTERVIKEE